MRMRMSIFSQYLAAAESSTATGMAFPLRMIIHNDNIKA